MMRADTALKVEQTRWEAWKVIATLSSVVVASLGAGAALFAGALAFFKWYYGP